MKESVLKSEQYISTLELCREDSQFTLTLLEKKGNLQNYFMAQTMLKEEIYENVVKIRFLILHLSNICFEKLIVEKKYVLSRFIEFDSVRPSDLSPILSISKGNEG